MLGVHWLASLAKLVRVLWEEGWQDGSVGKCSYCVNLISGTHIRCEGTHLSVSLSLTLSLSVCLSHTHTKQNKKMYVGKQSNEGTNGVQEVVQSSLLSQGPLPPNTLECLLPNVFMEVLYSVRAWCNHWLLVTDVNFKLLSVTSDGSLSELQQSSHQVDTWAISTFILKLSKKPPSFFFFACKNHP